MPIFFIILSFFALCACSHKTTDEPQMISIQLVDRHGFSETVSAKERISQYQTVDFQTPQPYQKVLRVYGRDKQGKTHSKITSYHSNGQIAYYLEIADGRAHGDYREWHENGMLKLQAHVIEGVADLTPIAQSSWLFEGKSQVWDENGNCMAEFLYEKGVLEGVSKYYYSSGRLEKEVPYFHNEIHGVAIHYHEDGSILEKTQFENGLKHGLSEGFWQADQVKFQEEFMKDQIKSGRYFSKNGELLCEVTNKEGKQAVFDKNHLDSLIEIHRGVPDGLVQVFGEQGELLREYRIKDRKKNGEEIEYYAEKPLAPKLLVTWLEDQLHGPVKTWYENGVMESQREVTSNKKHGMSFAWYKDGSLMLSEEYENDKVTKASYYKKGEKTPVSKIDSGKGTATLFDADGKFLKKIAYEKGKPLLDEQ
jgi:antitoxin component YwqK of YwqJK toxin-antitoxin module